MEQTFPARFQHSTGPALLVGTEPLSIEAPPASAVEIIVIVPAKDEAATITATLDALRRQVDLAGRPFDSRRYEVLLLANNCHDHTARVARRYAARYPGMALHVLERTLPPAEAHVGRARRLLMDAACRRLLAVGRPGGLIASTDADTLVAPDWLAATLAEAAAGADAVGGRILPQRPAEAACPVRRLHLRDAAFRLLCARLENLLDPQPHDPWPRHHQHFGGSLALSAAAYQRVGGLPVVPYLEDEALFRQLLHHDQRVRHSSRVQVSTSARQQGRVAVGLSWQLRQWADCGAAGREPLVDNPARLLTEWTVRRQLREAWAGVRAGQPVSSAAWPALAEVLHTTPAALLGEALLLSCFGAFWERASAAAAEVWAAQFPPLPLDQATATLRHLLRTLPAAETHSAPFQQVEPVRFAAVAV